MRFEYYINCHERGEFAADVRDSSGATVFEFTADNENDNGKIWPVDEGHMDNIHDVDGLAGLLSFMGIMKDGDTIVRAN